MASNRGVVYTGPGNVEIQSIDYPKLALAGAVNVEVISLDEAPEAYKAFDKGVAKKFVIDPHNTLQTPA